MACDLWVKGEAWTGSARIPIDVVWKTNFNNTIPPVAPQRNGGGPGDVIYSDGLGGDFSGTGWFGSPTYYLKGDCAFGAFDCVNGGCVPSITYGTPGKYASLAACMNGCAKDNPCTGECVSVAEIAALQQAATNLKARLCK